MADRERPRASAHANLSTYLNEHLLASEGGVRAFHAAAKTFEGSPHEQALLALADEVDRDRRDLARIIQGLGYRPKGWKRVLTVVLRAGGSVNPVNLLRLRRSSMAQFELDFLTGAVRAKLSMWQALLELSETDPRPDRALLDDLVRRAEHQIAELQRISRETVRERFA
ncbi:hypothetical protein [Agrococcus sp. HG114]|uniref:hypothetical protein n=1 Tax=Agrococcus sp. HG114 TaxID=2969757 RepID=UPI00215AE4F0|nr:hypothetical protein [Agrococcus sp. HG114]MCR8669610.1 hypothetical protein [Agrococcus sp. HG114]